MRPEAPGPALPLLLSSLLTPPPPRRAPRKQATEPWVRFQAGPASVVRSEAAIARELERFQAQPSGCGSGPRFGYAACETDGSGGPCRGPWA